MLLKDLCTLEAVCCTRDTSIRAVARLMQQQHTGDVIVLDDLVDERRPAGMVTDRDIVLKVIARDLDAGKVTAGEVMASPLVVGSAREETAVALERMRSNGVRRLPVTDERGAILGIVTLDDLLREHAERAQALLEVVTREQTLERRGRG